MLDDIIKKEEELQATLQTIKGLVEEHNIFPLKGMIEQLDKLINNSEFTLLSLRKWQIQNQKGETDVQTN
tara:strand:+ start:107 stop:316 length:210 start_codon:yes stop_codon:yes gene_type:complete